MREMKRMVVILEVGAGTGSVAGNIGMVAGIGKYVLIHFEISA